jgi:hypothetical protein
MLSLVTVQPIGNHRPLAGGTVRFVSRKEDCPKRQRHNLCTAFDIAAGAFETPGGQARRRRLESLVRDLSCL